ncbi:MAG: hypothetical protein IPM61_10035 [Chlorobi bacterium]|nr:MAG: hypothetical protein UZ07_CHB004002816 [Chlorobi bacterium OLB7]MBK8911654.1 hypothetical protein [Chlorobiota bacterium]MBX7216600.1 hypothetical protein [Candidatus Kapabacteria bacterium]
MTRFLASLLLLLLAVPAIGIAQNFSQFTEFYRSVRVNGLEQLVFAHPSTDPARDPSAYGVQRDSLGRPTMVMRFFFGNPHTRGLWTYLRIIYISNPEAGTTLQRRTFHAPNNAPMQVAYAHGEEALHRANGEIVRYAQLDREDRLLGKVPIVTACRYRYTAPNTLLQEWRFQSGKLHWVANNYPDSTQRFFVPAPNGAYFRTLTLDGNGEVVQEQLQGINKRPFPYQPGIYAVRYLRDSLGQITSIQYLGNNGQLAADTSGIASINLEYDDWGREVAWKAFGIDGKPHGRRSDGIATIIRQYNDFDGTLASEERTDAAGAAITDAPADAP